MTPDQKDGTLVRWHTSGIVNTKDIPADAEDQFRWRTDMNARR
jgi:hypothetical protein